MLRWWGSGEHSPLCCDTMQLYSGTARILIARFPSRRNILVVRFASGSSRTVGEIRPPKLSTIYLWDSAADRTKDNLCSSPESIDEHWGAIKSVLLSGVNEAVGHVPKRHHRARLALETQRWIEEHRKLKTPVAALHLRRDKRRFVIVLVREAKL